MHSEYPIEQLARSARTRFQIGFARMAMQLMPEMEGVLLEATKHGLVIMGRDELALAQPVAALQRMYPGEVELGEPRVRLLYDGGLREPVMWLRASLERDYCEPAVQELVAREAEMEEVDWLSPRPVVRARAPLRTLIGYPQTLAELSENTAEVRTWLSHYAPVPPGPGGFAA